MSRRRVVVAAALIAVASAVWYLVWIVRVFDSPMPITYWVIDDRTIGVRVIDGPSSVCDMAASENTTEVRVRVRCRRPFISVGSTGAGYHYDFVVQLEVPLADRTVLDGSGMPAKRCATPSC